MDLLELLKTSDYKQAIKLIEGSKKELKTSYEDLKKQYDVLFHDVNDPVTRKNKTVERPRTKKDGTPILDQSTNQPTFTKDTELVNRVALPYQKIIVKRRVGFLLGNPVEYRYDDFDKDESTVFNAFEAVMKDNKTEYRDRELAEILFSECECAEIWYKKEDKEFWENKQLSVGKKLNSPARLKMMIISRSKDDTLYPVFDAFGDMIVFERKFKGIVPQKKDPVDMVTIYTDEIIYELYKDGSDWLETDNEGESGVYPNSFGKIPVVYYRQEDAEWYDVQSLIDRKEEAESNLGDENDYYGKPILYAKGKISGFQSKKEAGKLLQGDKDTELKFISWEHAPASIELEFKELDTGIYTFSQTPDISFEKVKGIGNLTGIALKLMFTDAQMAARTKESIVGEGFQRRANIIKWAIGSFIEQSLTVESKQISIKPVFTPFLPEDLAADTTMLVDAYQGGIMSQKTAVERNKLVSNPGAELDQIQTEQTGGESVRV